VTDHRERIREHVAVHPGRHFSELVRALDLSSGQAQHHLRRLEGQGAVVGERLYGRTHYFPPEYDPEERRVIAVLRRETARDVVFHLLEAGPTPAEETATAVGIARSTLEWHLDRLLEQGVVEKRRDERGRVTLAVTDRQAVLASLEEITPSLPERLVDRFTRLVDGVLFD
jgi:predicted transcriptional regulator